jgi:hypothetical protein
MSKRPRIRHQRSNLHTNEPAGKRGVSPRPSSKRHRQTAGTVPATLRALREHLGKTQIEISRAMPMSQSQLSRLEGRHDHLVSTLRRYVEALGGEIEVVALVDGTRFALRDV